LLGRFFAPFASLAFDDVCADHCGRLRSELAAAGTPIGPNDLLIAATALAHELTLVTHNVREFSRVANLRVEDWEV
jgi:tRNA(fMet)-specific endonuclease VapC